MLRRLLYLLVFLFITAANVTAQLREKVKAIEQQVARMDADSSYIARTVEDGWFAAHGQSLPDLRQELSGYYKKDKLIMIIYALSSAASMSTTTYYFASGQLILVRTLIETYKTAPDGSSNLEKDHKGSYFFEKGDVIEYRNWGNAMYPHMNRSVARDHLLKLLEQHKQRLHENTKSSPRR